MKTNTKLMQVAVFSFSNMLAWLTMIGNWAFNIFLYFSIVYLLVDSEVSALDYALEFVPQAGQVRSGLKKSLVEKIDGVFTSSFEGALYQAIFTWIILNYAGVEYAFLYCLASAFFKTVPFVSTFVVGSVGALHFYLTTNNEHPFPCSVILLVVYSFVDGRLATEIFEKKLQKINSAMLGMSVFLGLYAFGF